MAARGVQGVGAALLLAGSLPVLGARMWTLAGTFGLALGPALGGVLTQAFTWRAIFVAQAPFAAAGLLFAVWGRLHLGKYWSGIITLKEGHRLIRTGPYRLVRHPLVPRPQRREHHLRLRPPTSWLLAHERAERAARPDLQQHLLAL